MLLEPHVLEAPIHEVLVRCEFPSIPQKAFLSPLLRFCVFSFEWGLSGVSITCKSLDRVTHS